MIVSHNKKNPLYITIERVLKENLRRAEDRIRTDDLRFTKALLYQLSYFGI